MDVPDINWVSKIADWAWAVILFVVMGLTAGAFKLWKEHIKHGVRLDVLEDHHEERVRKMDHLADSIEDSRKERMQQIDRLQMTVDANRTAFDNRLEAKTEQLRMDFRHDVRDILNATLLKRRQGE